MGRRRDERSRTELAAAGLDLGPAADTSTLLRELVPLAERLVAERWETWQQDREDFRERARLAIDDSLPALDGAAVVKAWSRFTFLLEIAFWAGIAVLIVLLGAILDRQEFTVFEYVVGISCAVGVGLLQLVLQHLEPLRKSVIGISVAASASSVLFALLLMQFIVVSVVYGTLFGLVLWITLAGDALWQILLPRMLNREQLRRSDPLSILQVLLLILSASFDASESPTTPIVESAAASSRTEPTAKASSEPEDEAFLSDEELDELRLGLLTAAVSVARKLFAPHSDTTSVQVRRSRQKRAQRVAMFLHLQSGPLLDDDPRVYDQAVSKIAEATAATLLERWDRFTAENPSIPSNRRRLVVIALLGAGVVLPFLSFLPGRAIEIIAIEVPLILALLTITGLVSKKEEPALQAVSEAVSGLSH